MKNQVLTGPGKSNGKLHIVYAMTHVGICGGVKVIFEHANKLQNAGAKVTLVSHYQKPNWFPIETDYIQVPFDLELAKGIPDCDVIVATYWDHIQACIESGIAPVVYFEQGDFHLFDYDSMNLTLKNFIQRQYEVPPFVFTVSNQAAGLITKIYGREAQVFPNAVDESVFCVNGEKELGERPYLLMVGGESAAFKGIPDIINAYEKVKEELDIDLYWITPEEPSEKLRSRVTRVFVNPRQQKIGSLYRGAAIYVCGSTYENFPLPPLEAMACGCPVVTTNNTGSLEYAVHEQNAFICNMRDPVDMAEKIKEVFSNDCLKESLITNGLATANHYNWKTIIQNILEYYKNIAEHEVSPENTLEDWDIAIREKDCLNKEDYIRLKKMLLVTNADIVRVPVIYSIEKVPQIARWEVVAIRKNSDGGMVEECYCPEWPLRKLYLYNLKGYQSFLEKQYDKALDEFTQLYNGDQSKDKAVWARWIVLTLIRLQRKQEAKRKLNDFIKEYPHNADFYKLRILAGERDHPDSFSIEAIKILGEATASSEFFYKIEP
ncbi:glycosyltransferase family 4 protein [Mesobacillus subterraneus]|uniref:glycosyltransferase family 4 protein n=1 Tax=Mesobacillus subterraneus TaxID=285983 RepID=UPI001CFD9D58|nr:glycosyltransferase family 4 protein [Mesobacillus subterraneus]WLR54790.1 glycosyltransferase family 4 protein [Mesobacillus subterraneus]